MARKKEAKKKRKLSELPKIAPPKKQKKISRSLPSLKILNEHDIAMDFATKVYREFNTLIKSIVLFGSSVRKQPLDALHSHDIDVLIIVNDLTLILNDEVTQSYRVIVHNLASKHAKRLHITTMTLRFSARASLSTERVCGIGPSWASMIKSAPSAMESVRSTSPEKSACPGVSMILILVPWY